LKRRDIIAEGKGKNLKIKSEGEKLRGGSDIRETGKKNSHRWSRGERSKAAESARGEEAP